jgi:hypothetical protein
VLPMPLAATASVTGQGNAGVSDVYARTLAGSRAMVGTRTATLAGYVGRVERGGTSETGARQAADRDSNHHNCVQQAITHAVVHADKTATVKMPRGPAPAEVQAATTATVKMPRGPDPGVIREVVDAPHITPLFPHQRRAPRCDGDLAACMKGTEFEDADSESYVDEEEVLARSPIRTPYDDPATWEVPAVTLDPGVEVPRTGHNVRHAARAPRSFTPLGRVESAPVAAARRARNEGDGNAGCAPGPAAGVCAQSRVPRCDDAGMDTTADDDISGVCFKCGYAGEAARCSFGRAACAAQYCPSCRDGRECECEEEPSTHAEATVQWRTVPLPVEEEMLDALVAGTTGLVVRTIDDPSVKEVACGDQMVVTSADRAVFMRVTSVARFESEVAAWHELGHHVLRGADATWTRERVLLYFSRFYLSNRGHPPVVVVGLTPMAEMARMTGAEAVRRRYRGCGYPWP